MSIERTLFDSDPERYDHLFDWRRRLDAEAPFFRSLFAEVSARRVLDAACGTGRHAALFRGWGLHVEGADASEAMVAFCRSRRGESDRLRWRVRSFDAPVPGPGSFDVAICVGNSIALTADDAALRAVLRELTRAVRPGGEVIVHAVNLWRLPEGVTTWQSCRRRREGDTDQLLLKGMRRAGATGHIELVAVDLAGGRSEARYETPTFRGIEPRALQEAARDAGGEPRLLGSLRAEEPYDRESSPDIVLRSRRLRGRRETDRDAPP